MRRIFALVVVVLTLTPIPVAQACSCMPVTPLEAVEGGSVAFVGTPIDVRANPDPNSFEGRIWTFEVETVLKGEVPEFVDVASARDSGACGYDFTNAGRVGVVAYGAPGSLGTGLCGGVWAAEQLLDEVGPGTPPVTGDPPVAVPPPTEADGDGTPLLWLATAGLVLSAAALGIWGLRHRRPRAYVEGFGRAGVLTEPFDDPDQDLT